jgi:hypothetical protein
VPEIAGDAGGCMTRPVDPSAESVCKMFLPASRVNVYPDELELVWFDGRDVKNPSYALYVALLGLDQDQQLCSQQQQDKSKIDFIQREWATSERDYLLVQ